MFSEFHFAVASAVYVSEIAGGVQRCVFNMPLFAGIFPITSTRFVNLSGRFGLDKMIQEKIPAQQDTQDSKKKKKYR